MQHDKTILLFIHSSQSPTVFWVKEISRDEFMLHGMYYIMYYEKLSFSEPPTHSYVLTYYINGP